MKNILARFKSPIVISNIVAAIVAILVNLQIVETGETIVTVVNMTVGILIAVGVLNNPSDKNNF